MFLISNSTDSKEIGKYPQIERLNNDIPNFNQISLDLLNLTEKLNYEPKLSYTASYKAKLTDLISVSQVLLISDKLLEILLTSNIENFQYFPVEIIHRKKTHKYNLYFIYGQDYSLVDYQNMKFWGVSSLTYSDFYREPHEREGGKKKEIKVESPFQIINWLKLYSDYSGREYEALKLNYANIHTDMIRLPSLLDGSYFVSEELKNKIEAAKCTGLDFRTKDWRERPIL
jgi:hypothetical protein